MNWFFFFSRLVFVASYQISCLEFSCFILRFGWRQVPCQCMCWMGKKSTSAHTKTQLQQLKDFMGLEALFQARSQLSLVWVSPTYFSQRKTNHKQPASREIFFQQKPNWLGKRQNILHNKNSCKVSAGRINLRFEPFRCCFTHRLLDLERPPLCSTPTFAALPSLARPNSLADRFETGKNRNTV